MLTDLLPSLLLASCGTTEPTILMTGYCWSGLSYYYLAKGQDGRKYLAADCMFVLCHLQFKDTTSPGKGAKGYTSL